MHEDFTRTANLLRRKRRHDAPRAKTLYTFTPPHPQYQYLVTQGSAAAFFLLGSRGPLSGGRTAPSIRKAEPCVPTFCLLAPLAFCRFAAKNTKIRGTCSGFSRLRIARLACFGLRERSQSLARLVFVLWERSHAFPEAFSPFGSVPTTFSTHFQSLGAFHRIHRSVFGLREYSIAFIGAVLSFGSLPNAHTGIVRAWRGNHTKSFHQEDEPWQRRQLQK